MVLLAAAGLAARTLSGAHGDPPVVNKIVIVFEENRSLHAVLGSGEAPYLDTLAAGGANLHGMYALTHPSQPNYLEFFSGSHQGNIANELVPGTPLTTPNLGAAVIAAGGTFAGYSESMPSVGYTEWDAEGGLYARRHNPWVNWQADAPGPNQLAPGTNQPFTAFPTDFNLLPRVSIVIPNNINNSHDSTIGQMDAWLAANMQAYAAWARDNDSLLIITFDEDESLDRNRIPTILYGGPVAAGTVLKSTYTLHNLLRTVGDLVGAAPPGAGARVKPIVGAFTGDPTPRTVSFRQGVKGYASAHDVTLASATPTTPEPDAVRMRSAELPTLPSSPTSHALVRFDDFFGAGTQLVPPDAEILSAKLVLHTLHGMADPNAKMSLHRMLTPWNDNATWNSLVAGVSADGVEAVATAEFSVFPNVFDLYGIFDVTASVQAWAEGAPNHGWAILPSGNERWDFDSTEAIELINRPVLEITFSATHSADFDYDDAVDAADLAEWTQAYGTPSHADADRDADADGNDFLTWQRQLGQSAPPPATIPEPSASVIACLIAYGLARRRNLRRA